MKETKSAFARRLGVAPSYVTKLGEEGRLVLDGRFVDVEASLAKIDATKDPNRDDVRQRHAKARDQKRLAVAQSSPVAAQTAPGAGEGPTEAQEAPQTPAKENEPVVQAADVFRKARTAKMHYEARRAVIRVARLQGRLTDMAIVRRAAGNDGASLRAMLENLPDRAAPVLAPVRDPVGAAGILGKLLDDIETEWTDMLVKHAAEMRATAT